MSCSCEKVTTKVRLPTMERSYRSVTRSKWDPECEEHGVDTPAWTERVTSPSYQERARKILAKLDDIRRKR